jgi:hypothetical protein
MPKKKANADFMCKWRSFMRCLNLFVAVLVVFLAASISVQAIPQLMNYQGVLTDSNGDPVTTPTDVVFAIWNDRVAGDSLWSETQLVTPDTNGLFSVLLGSVSPIPDSSLIDSAFLSLKVDTDPEMAPRTELASVAYAYRVNSLEGAKGGELIGSVVWADSLASFDIPMIYLFDPPPTGSHTRPIIARAPDRNDWGLRYNTVPGFVESFAFYQSGTILSIDMLQHRVGVRTDSPEADLDVAGVVKGQVAEFGTFSTRSGQKSALGGGGSNSAIADFATVSGGSENTAAGEGASVPGGVRNNALGRTGLAAGYCARANHDGAMVLSATASTIFHDSVSSGGDGQFVIRADSGIYLTNTTEGAPYDPANIITTRGGAFLSGNGTTWTNASDKNHKENFTPIDREDLLEKIAQLSIESWNYKGENPDVKHIGPVAQEFSALFDVSYNDKSISTIDPAGIALAAIQELDKKTQRIEKLEAEIRELRELVTKMIEKQ